MASDQLMFLDFIDLRQASSWVPAQIKKKPRRRTRAKPDKELWEVFNLLSSWSIRKRSARRRARDQSDSSVAGRALFPLGWPTGCPHGPAPPLEFLITCIKNISDLKTRGELVIFSVFRFVAALVRRVHRLGDWGRSAGVGFCNCLRARFSLSCFRFHSWMALSCMKSLYAFGAVMYAPAGPKKPKNQRTST